MYVLVYIIWKAKTSFLFILIVALYDLMIRDLPIS